MLYTSTQGFLAITLKCAYGHWVFGCVWHYRCCVTIRRRFLRISKGICRSIYFTCTLIYTHTHADTLVHVIIHPWAVIVYQIQSVIYIYIYIYLLYIIEYVYCACCKMLLRVTDETQSVLNRWINWLLAAFDARSAFYHIKQKEKKGIRFWSTKKIVQVFIFLLCIVSNKINVNFIK